MHLNVKKMIVGVKIRDKRNSKDEELKHSQKKELQSRNSFSLKSDFYYCTTTLFVDELS